MGLQPGARYPSEPRHRHIFNLPLSLLLPLFFVLPSVQVKLAIPKGQTHLLNSSEELKTTQRL